MIAATGVALACIAGATVAWATGNNAAQPALGAQPHLAAAAPIDSTTESKFTPITPCRAANTRVAGGILPASGARDFYLGGTFGFAPEGGTSGGCGVPLNATGVALTITTVNTTHNGYLKVWATGSAQPATAFMNYGTVSNSSVSGIAQIGSAGRARIQTYGSPANVVLDVTGYYTAPMTAEVASGGTLVHGSRTTNSFLISGTTSSYQVDFDRDVSNCSYAASSYFSNYTLTVEPRSGDAHGVYVMTEFNGTASADQFYLTVTC